MNELQNFNFEGKEIIRTIQQDSFTWFAANDVASTLGLSNTTVAINRLDDDEVTKFNLGGLSGETNFISEAGLYKLIGSSRKPAAKKFNRWVTHEVLPTIRRHGAYMTDARIEEVLSDPDTIIKLATDLKGERVRRLKAEQVITEQRPKVLFAESVETSHTSILVGDLAKILRGNGIQIGANRLFGWMRDNGYLIAGNRSDKNMPTQRSMEMGLFEVKETAITHSDGHTSISKTVKVTGRGQQYFIAKFLGRDAA